MGLTLTGREFRRFWRMFDTSGDDRIDYTEFNNKVGRMISPPSMGLQLNRPETPQMKEWQRKSMAARIRKQVSDIDATFKTIDTDGSGLISQPEFIQALRAMGVRGIGDTESWSMMSRFRAAGNDTGQMTLDEFRSCMMDLLKVGASSEKRDAEGEAQLEALEAAEAVLERAVPREEAAARAALSRFDDDRLGDLSHDQLRRALTALVGASLPPDQFAAVVAKYDPTNDGSVGIVEFARLYAAGTAGGAGKAGGGSFGHTGADAHWARLGLRPGVDQTTGVRMDLRKVRGMCGRGAPGA
jgi:Ca2+-binding EF-hand superfamily protein